MTRPATVIPITLGLLVFGCSLARHLGLAEEEPAPLAFSHRVHCVDEELECMMCHSTYDSDDDPGMPVKAQCMLCHEDIDAEKPVELRIDGLFEGEVYRAGRVSALPDEVVFSHAAHALDEELCGSCHVGIETSDRVDAAVAAGSMDQCSDCHSNLGLPNDCKTCHSELHEGQAPATHALGWEKAHGVLFRTGSRLTVNRCDLCHQRNECNDCHHTVPPDNHTNHWRRRGHGLTARMDRRSCSACHTTDSCDACHQTTRPRSHAGASWGSGQSRHCLSCHITDSESGCVTCHKGAPSHGLATPQPPDHSPGMNCLQCHGAGAPLPHVHKGEDCTICHM